MWEKFKAILSDDTLYLGMVFVLAVIVAFGLGRLAERAALSTAVSTVPAAGLTFSEPVAPTTTTVVASKSGTKYHLPWCPGAQQMKEENKITFESPAAAEAAGYTPAANCKGL